MVAVRTFLSVLAVAITFLEANCDVSNRDVTVTQWPNCADYQLVCDQAKQHYKNVVYAKAASAGDSLLYAFSTIGIPSVVMARVTGADTDMHFNWNMLMKGPIENAITIHGTGSTVEYRFGVAFTRLIEYNDISDNADLTSEETLHNSSYWKIKDLGWFNWTIYNDSSVENSVIFKAFSENNPQALISDSVGNWSITFSFKVQKDSGRSADLPSLKYGANETLFDFVMSNYTPEYAKSRFAVETVLVSRFTNTNMTIDTTQSIDDEYSPGVFQVVNWLSDPSQEDSSGYLQWKPACYNSKSRSRSTGTLVKHYTLSDLTNRKNMTSLLNESLIFALFGADLYNDMLVISQATNISFGLSEDGFFTQTNYTVWTAAIGYGSPPVDTISLTVIIIISAGLGLPVIILILGGVFTCVRKAKKRSQYEAINSDRVSSSQPLVN